MTTLAKLVVAVMLASCSRSEPPPQVERAAPAKTSSSKDPAAARALIERGAVVLDVRTPDEFAGGHLPTAVNVPVEDLAARMGEVEQLVAGDKHRPIVVYCASGRRAGKAQAQLESAGYAQVVNGGGFDDLQ